MRQCPRNLLRKFLTRHRWHHLPTASLREDSTSNVDELSFQIARGGGHKPLTPSTSLQSTPRPSLTPRSMSILFKMNDVSKVSNTGTAAQHQALFQKANGSVDEDDNPDCADNPDGDHHELKRRRES